MNTPDNKLMNEVRAGQVGQMAVLFERHHRALFRYFVSMHRDKALAEDLVQDVFFRMLRYRASFDAGQSFMAWMYQIAHNAGVDSARKQHASIVDIDDYEDRRPEFASSEPGPEEAAVRNQDLELLGRALDLLPEDKREVLVLSRLQGMKYEDIAAVLRCEVATVKVRVHRAVRALEQLFLGLQKEKVS